jgi:uncharacterized heparinase superfamily protein
MEHRPMTVAKLRWTWQRLRAMGAPELAHRVREHARRRTARRATALDRFDAGAGPLPCLRGFPRLSPGEHASLRERWRRVADAAIAGKHHSLGRTWPGVTGPEKWHLDIETGGVWPKEPYCFDISYRFDERRGDIKYAFELNRLQHLQPIAALAAAENDLTLAAFCARELESWIDANPPFRGINWCSGIELALRIVSFLITVHFIGRDAFSESQKRKIRMTLNAHGYWLERYPSRYSSANNHLISEAAGLFLLGALAPDLPGADRYERYGRQTLAEEIQKQILEDGVGAEQSPTYTCFVIEWMLLCAAVAKRIGRPFPQAFEERLAAAGEHLLWIIDQCGHHPRIGDDDEGRVLYSQIEAEDKYVSSVLGCLSAALGRPDLAPPFSQPHLRNLLLGFPAAPGEPARGVRVFPAGGYTAVRETLGARDVFLLFDHGPLGYLSIAAHGHADALALALHIDGRPVLIDAGTYRYLSGGAWRDYFRGTAAHNTLTIAGESQSLMAGPFNWSQKASAKLTGESMAAGRWKIEAEHNGYKGRFGLIHRRLIMQECDNAIVCHDTLAGAPARQGLTAEIRFIVAPDLSAVPSGEGAITISRDGDALCTIVCDHSDGRAAPIAIEEAFVSPCFGTKLKTSSLVWRFAVPELIHAYAKTKIVF